MVEPRERLVEILVVEKSCGAIVLLRRALLECWDFPYQLSIVHSGEEAMAFLDRHPRYWRVPRPDVVILSLGLPDLSGWEVLRRIRATPALRNMSVVVMGCVLSPEDEAHRQALQPAVLLQKPSHFAEYERLAESIAELIRPTMPQPEPGDGVILRGTPSYTALTERAREAVDEARAAVAQANQSFARTRAVRQRTEELFQHLQARREREAEQPPPLGISPPPSRTAQASDAPPEPVLAGEPSPLMKETE